MSGDGSALGITPERALKTILGGEPSPEATGEETMTPEQAREWIMSVPDGPPASYDDAVRVAAKRILAAFDAHPGLRDAPMDTEYDWEGDPDHGADGFKPAYLKRLGLYERMKEVGYPLADLDLTGFQWGFAVNLARDMAGLAPQPNPAIIEIRP